MESLGPLSAPTTPAIPPPMRPPPATLSRQEMLEIENAMLKIANIKLNADVLQRDLAKAADMLKEAQEAARRICEALSLKYGVNISSSTVGDDGTLTPLAGAMP